MTGAPDFTFVTYDGLPDLDPDDRVAVDALAKRGIRVNAAVWNDPAIDWTRAGTCILRSTWDYHLHHERFLAWAETVSSATQLWNPLPVVRWNAHKRYLQDLADRGAPIVPTAWLNAGSSVDIEAFLRRRGWDRAVVKPAVGLATRGVMRVDATEDGLSRGQAHVQSLLRQHDVMVQPFMESVDKYGERALIFIAGQYTHTVRKTAFQPLAAAGEAGEVLVDGDAEEIALAERVSRMIDTDVLYARVDLVRGEDGAPRVIELELVEPSLFLSLYPPAAVRFADALQDLL